MENVTTPTINIDNTEVLKELDLVVKKMEEKMKDDNFIELDFKNDCRIYGEPDQVKKLFASYSKYFGEVTNPKNTKSNPFHKNKYAPLEEVLNTIRQVMSSNGLALIQFPVMDGANVVINNILTHIDGAYMTIKGLAIRPTKTDAQGIGATMTYGRRYSASTICGVSSEEDDDGNVASGISNGQKKTPTSNPSKPKPLSEFDKLKKEVGELAKTASKKSDASTVKAKIEECLGSGKSISKSTSKDTNDLKKLKAELNKI